MTRHRSSVSKRLTKFLYVISKEIPNNYGVTLQGSWAHGEYHAIIEDGLVRSFSDVDFVCAPSTLSQTSCVALESLLFSTAESCNLKLKGISIRPEEEMRDMWKLHVSGQDIDTQKKRQSEFIQFWVLIGAVEVCVAQLNSLDNSIYTRNYHLNKFFLSIWRDIGIVNGHCLESYHNTLAFVARFLSADICNASYALKLGIETPVFWDTIQSAHLLSIYGELNRLIHNESDLNATRYAIDSLIRFEFDAFELMAMERLTEAKKFEDDLSVRKAARIRLYNKLLRKSK